MRTHLNLSRVNKIETLYERSRVYVKVEPRSTSTLTCGLSYIASISFSRVKFTCVRTDKIAQQWKSALSRISRGSQWWCPKISAVFSGYGRERVCKAIVKYSVWRLGALESLVVCVFLRWLLCCALHCFVSCLEFHLLLSCIY